MSKITNPAQATEVAPPFAIERQAFKLLMLSNPNHFGNFPGLGPVQVQIENSTAYEQLLCLGLNPAADTLEAVLEIKQAGGYDSGPCDGGSTEYVRFYVQRERSGGCCFGWPFPAARSSVSAPCSSGLTAINKLEEIE